MEWTQEFALGDVRIDATHQEFVGLVNALGNAHDNEMLAAVDALIAHTQTHFGQESGWMAATACPTAHCHLDEHAGVLAVMQEVRGYVGEGKFNVGRVLARELETWFRQHAATMDTMLAHWLRARGFDTSQPLDRTSEPADPATQCLAGCAAEDRK